MTAATPTALKRSDFGKIEFVNPRRLKIDPAVYQRVTKRHQVNR